MTASERYQEVLVKYRKVLNAATEKRDEVYQRLRDAKLAADRLHEEECRDVRVEHDAAEAAMMAERNKVDVGSIKAEPVELPDGT